MLRTCRLCGPAGGTPRIRRCVLFRVSCPRAGLGAKRESAYARTVAGIRREQPTYAKARLARRRRGQCQAEGLFNGRKGGRG